ncbi:hypothetical protein POM88_034767 [Heracleum sosnowskyi]|uniref:NUA/TPR/MLP1-2-like domain-containing protein n=1 Tax=Heracleum sosnowskyi TaxID=360622 RepID=A0AAD8HJX0_9APIA|nr:hypothetical protein POM88_034767 [Heracleum sosnowskyi]
MLILVVWHENEFNNDLDGDAMIISAYQITVESDAQRVIFERLVTFKDINGLVEHNTQLRSLVRRLSDQIENREAELKVPSNLCHYSLFTVNLMYVSPIHLPRTTASSRAQQPPWPKSCVMGCMASPATANTHVNIHQDLKDVKIWQVHTLLKGLENIDVSADIPMLVCGDFNSVPGSAPHALQALGKVDHMHPELAVDPLGIMCPANKLLHQLPLVSAYSSFARIGANLGFEQQKRRMDPNTNEPLFPNGTRDFLYNACSRLRL